MAARALPNHGQRAGREPLFDIHPRTGATLEVFYADRTVETFGRCGAGWFWWSRRRGYTPSGPAAGPFPTRYTAYRDAVTCKILTYRPGTSSRPRNRCIMKACTARGGPKTRHRCGRRWGPAISSGATCLISLAEIVQIGRLLRHPTPCGLRVAGHPETTGCRVSPEAPFGA